MASREARHSFRFSVDGEATVRWSGHARRYAIENLSLGGALFVGGPAPARGEHVQALLRARGRRVLLRGRVVRAHTHTQIGSFAMAFTQLGAGAEDAIQDLSLATVEPATGATVLLVGRGVYATNALARCLREQGWSVTRVATPIDAIRRLQDGHLDVRWVAVFDRLTQTSSSDFLQYVAEEHPTVQRLLITCAEAGDQAREVVTQGLADQALSEPIQMAAVRRIVGRGPRDRV
ncbi:MAG TPA: PilZ domain-containing protein [Kofleriaceae bacterium]|nr:PilZ domain-containing protein [Kofleriaceae bacterium]